MSEIIDNIGAVRRRIAGAAARAGREPAGITLIAVTKTVSVERMREAANAGIEDFGESYYQEVREKLDRFAEPIRWHFIGHVQSNKVHYLVGRFALIHSIDSVELAEEIGKRAVARGIVQPILLEVKLDLSGAKFGFALESCLPAADQVLRIRGIDLQGFMGMAPYGADPELSRPLFRQLHNRFAALPQGQGRVLSMGMTGDFEVAIEEGATHVRVGTAIFGSRPTTLA